MADIQLPINLFSRNPNHSIPQSTYLLPSSWRRFQLSSLINKVLAPSDPIPFDFIIDGELLRGSLESWVKARRGGDMETRLDVEFVESLLPPKQEGSFPQDDWVSGVSLGRPGHILLSSYLSHAKIIPLVQETEGSSPSITLQLPTPLGATCVNYLSSPDSSSPLLIGAGGMDRQAHIFSLPSDALSGAAPLDQVTGSQIMSLHLHTGPVSSISANADNTKCLTSSWDGLLGVFTLPTLDNPLEQIHDLPAQPTTYLTATDRRNKKRRIQNEKDNGLTPANSEGWRKRPDVVLRGHTARIGGALWDNQAGDEIWSAAWDGSVRAWDVEMGSCKEVKQGPSDRAALCIAQMSTGTIVTGHMDRVVCLWDARESQSLISLSLPTPSPTPSITAHPTSAYTLSTAHHTGHINIFDIRSPKQALFTTKKEPRKDGKIVGGGTGERLLASDWDGQRLVAGGEDGEVGVWSAKGE